MASHGPLVAVEDRVKGAQSRPWRPEIRNQTVCVWRGRKKLHYLNPVPLHEIHTRWIAKFEHGRLDALHHLKKTLEGPKDDNDNRKT